MNTKFLWIILSLIFIIGCSDENEETYKYVLNLSSNTIDEFSKLGETRTCYVEFSAKPDLSEKDVEKLLRTSSIDFKSDKDIFKFSDYQVTGNRLIFDIICPENKTEKMVNDEICITISNKDFSVQVSDSLKQAASDIRYEFKIESKTTDPYTIPAEGGVYQIPLKSKRLTYINDNLVSEEPYSLKGIRYVSKCVNMGWRHMDWIYQHGAVGDYIIELTATGPYNIIGDCLWKVELMHGETTIYVLNILHIQTPGEEYYIGNRTNFESSLIDE